MAVSMMQHKKASGGWQTVKSKTDDKKKKVEEKKKQEVVEDRLGVTVPKKKDAFADFDAAWAKKQAQPVVNQVKDDTPYNGAFAGLTVEPVTIDSPESPSTPQKSDSQPTTEANQSKAAEPKVKKPKKVKPSIAQVAEGVSTSALKASFEEWEQKYDGNEVSQLEMLADFFLKTFKECELPFNNLLSEKPLQKVTEIPLSEMPQSLIETVQLFLERKQDESLKAIVIMLLSVTFEGLPEGLKSRTGVPPPKAKVGLLTLLSLVLRTCPQALLAAAPELLQAGRTFTAPGRIPQLLWVFNQAATSSPSAALAAWTRIILPQLLGSDATKKADTAESKVPTMDSSAHASVLDYADQLFAEAEADVQLSGAGVPTVPGHIVEAVSQSCYTDSYTGPAPTSTRSCLGELFPRLQALAAKSSNDAHFAEWLPLALETAAASSSGFEGAGDDTVARATTSVVACLAGSISTHALYVQKHKGLIKGSSKVLQRLAHSPASVLRPVTSKPEVAASFKRALEQLPARHKFYLHQARGKGWQGAAARASENAISTLTRKVGRTGGSSASSGSPSLIVPVLLFSATAVGVWYAAQHRAAVVEKASEYLSPEVSAYLQTALEAVDTTVSPHVQTVLTAVQPHLEAAHAAVRPHVEAAHAAVAPHLQAAQETVSDLLQQAASHPLGQQAQAHVQDAVQKVQALLSGASS